MKGIAFISVGIPGWHTALAQIVSFTAWQTGRGPAIAYQAQSTNNSIAYSVCSLQNNVIAPGKAPFLFQGTDEALYASSLAVAGWIDSSDRLWASLFFQTVTRDIMNVQYVCNTDTGEYEMHASMNVSENAAVRLPASDRNAGSPDVHSYAGMTALLITEGPVNEQPGHYLFYEDYSQNLQMIHAPGQPYRPAWSSAEIEPLGLGVGRRPMYATASANFDPHGSGAPVLRLLSVASPATHLQLSTSSSSGSWTNATIPIYSPDWDDELKSVGLGSRYGIGEGYTEHVAFFIGKDSLLHMTFSVANSSDVPLTTNAGPDTIDTHYEWPPSAENGVFGMVTTEMAHGLAVHIFYENSEGMLMQALGTIDNSMDYNFKWSVSAVDLGLQLGLPSASLSSSTLSVSQSTDSSSTETSTTSTSTTSTPTTPISLSSLSASTLTVTLSPPTTFGPPVTTSGPPATASTSSAAPVSALSSTASYAGLCLWKVIAISAGASVAVLLAAAACMYRRHLLRRRHVHYLQQHPPQWNLPVGLSGARQAWPLEPLRSPMPQSMAAVPPMYAEMMGQDDGKSTAETAEQTETVRTVVTTTTTTTTRSGPDEIGVAR